LASTVANLESVSLLIRSNAAIVCHAGVQAQALLAPTDRNHLPV